MAELAATLSVLGVRSHGGPWERGDLPIAELNWGDKGGAKPAVAIGVSFDTYWVPKSLRTVQY